MKRFISFLVLFSIAVCLLSCSYRGSYEDGYAAGYTDGYSDAESEMRYLAEEEFSDGYDIGRDDGYDIGYDDGESEMIASLEYEIGSLAWDIADLYGIHPAEAVEILTNYADVPEEVDEEELLNSIQAIYHYYYSSKVIFYEMMD